MIDRRSVVLGLAASAVAGPAMVPAVAEASAVLDDLRYIPVFGEPHWLVLRAPGGRQLYQMGRTPVPPVSWREINEES